MTEFEKLALEVNLRIKDMQETMNKIAKTEDLELLLQGKEFLFGQISWFKELEIKNSPFKLTGGAEKVRCEIGEAINDRLFHFALKAIGIYRIKKAKNKLNAQFEKLTSYTVKTCLEYLTPETQNFYAYSLNLEDLIQELFQTDSSLPEIIQ